MLVYLICFPTQTSDWTVHNSILLSDTIIMAGFPSKYSADELKEKLPEKTREGIQEVSLPIVHVHLCIPVEHLWFTCWTPFVYLLYISWTLLVYLLSTFCIPVVYQLNTFGLPVEHLLYMYTCCLPVEHLLYTFLNFLYTCCTPILLFVYLLYTFLAHMSFSDRLSSICPSVCKFFTFSSTPEPLDQFQLN